MFIVQVFRDAVIAPRTATQGSRRVKAVVEAAAGTGGRRLIDYQAADRQHSSGMADMLFIMGMNGCRMTGSLIKQIGVGDFNRFFKGILGEGNHNGEHFFLA